jgi:putative FmdB family regulatory protein
MPIYKYECKSCAHIFEDLRGLNDPNPDECPECGDSQIERLITGGNFQLKGSGWYVTDYGGKSKADSPSTSSESAEPSETTSASDASNADSAGGSSDGTEAA